MQYIRNFLGEKSSFHILLGTKELRGEKWKGMTSFHKPIVPFIIHETMVVVEESSHWEAEREIQHINGKKRINDSMLPIGTSIKGQDNY